MKAIFRGMTMLALAFFLLLALKHAIADGPLQTEAMVFRKAFYGDPAGAVHAVIHAALTVAVAFAFVHPVAAIAIGFADGLVHYHVDWLKAKADARFKWTVADGKDVVVRSKLFWHALVLDQTIHFATYAAIVALSL